MIFSRMIEKVVNGLLVVIIQLGTNEHVLFLSQTVILTLPV